MSPEDKMKVSVYLRDKALKIAGMHWPENVETRVIKKVAKFIGTANRLEMEAYHGRDTTPAE